MTKRFEIYRCEICGNIVQIMHGADGELVCCDKPMTLLKPHTQAEERQEKHIPVFFNETEIQVGSTPHPMLPEHHIEFIESISEDKKNAQIRFLDINDEPKMTINVETNYNSALEYCNLHGLWQGDKEYPLL